MPCTGPWCGAVQCMVQPPHVSVSSPHPLMDTLTTNYCHTYTHMITWLFLFDVVNTLCYYYITDAVAVSQCARHVCCSVSGVPVYCGQCSQGGTAQHQCPGTSPARPPPLRAPRTAHHLQLGRDSERACTVSRVTGEQEQQRTPGPRSGGWPGQ